MQRVSVQTNVTNGNIEFGNSNSLCKMIFDINGNSVNYNEFKVITFDENGNHRFININLLVALRTTGYKITDDQIHLILEDVLKKVKEL